MLLESLRDSCFSIKSFLSSSVVKLSKDLRSSGEGPNVGSIRFKGKGTDYTDNFNLGAFEIGGGGGEIERETVSNSKHALRMLKFIFQLVREVSQQYIQINSK